MYRQDYWTCRTQTLQVYSRHALCKGTGLQPCPTALEITGEQWLTSRMELTTAAGFMSSTFGWGVTAGVSHAGLLSPRPSCSRRRPSLTLADTLKRHRDEQEEVYCRQQAQDASDESASESDWKSVLLYSMLYTMLYNTCYIQCYITGGGVI